MLINILTLLFYVVMGMCLISPDVFFSLFNAQNILLFIVLVRISFLLGTISKELFKKLIYKMKNVH